ncbi:hypothetical protein Q5H92_09035 [Hymenobacter sp. M29]|uniref:WYL domain-containing protein n=1 Tax=Hymenobacter mellowenesis TaxID=3063995 RepID=A0ABT9AAV6_9BACT|nr:hypothetical protein [Hymenobacter sp. M29]MDO7846499.1 hypothetical protein [Hymenobacter sp. M29]
MQNQLKSFVYFSSQPLGCDYILRDVISNKLHPCHEAVMHDIASISQSELSEFVNKFEIERLIGRSNDKEFEKRVWFIESALRDAIVKERVTSLIDGDDVLRPSPYDGQEFEGVFVSDKKLVSIKDFDYSNHGLTLGNAVFQLCPSLPQNNSSYWLFELICQEAFRSNLDFKLRLDPIVKMPKEEFSPMFYKMWVYGRELNWDRIAQLKQEEFGQWLNEDSTSAKSIEATDFVWQPSKSEIHFTCEELPKDEFSDTRGSRYFHAIFDRQTGQVIHCDGALRFYSQTELKNRKQFHVRHAEVRRVGKRVKLFQIDEPISQQLFMNLATTFLVWNEDALAYFN